MFPAWFMGRHPEESIILATYSDKLSWDFGREVREIIEDPIYGQVFPGIPLKTASASIASRPIRAASCSSSARLRHHRPRLHRPADRRPDQGPRRGRQPRHPQEAVGLVQPGRQDAAALLRRLDHHHPDPLARGRPRRSPDRSAEPGLLAPAEGPKWKIIDLPALAIADDDVLGRKEGEALWPARFPVTYLEDMRAADPRGFQALYQGSPDAGEGQFLSRRQDQDLQPQRAPAQRQAALLRRVSDHAVSTTQDRDKTCLMIVGVDEDQNIWIMEDMVWGALLDRHVVERMIDLMAKYKPLLLVGRTRPHLQVDRPVPAQAHAGAQHLLLDLRGDAGQRQADARPVDPGPHRHGHGLFPAFAPWWMEARQEILQFPFGARDDFVDALPGSASASTSCAAEGAAQEGKPLPKSAPSAG